MIGVIGNMIKKLFMFSLFTLSSLVAVAADNEIYIDQSGANSSIDLEQLGSSNIIGGLNSSAGDLTALDLDGLSMTLDINQIGDTNKFLGDIFADSSTGFFEFDGDSNSFTIQIDPTDSYSADNSNWNVDVTGNTNTFTLNQGVNALSEQLDLDWIVQGSGNTFSFNIDIDGATSYIDLDGDDNTITYDGDGYAGGYFYLDQTGDDSVFSIQQQSTLALDWLKIIQTGNNANICIIQSDGGTSTSC